MTPHPTVSFVVPTLNRGQYVIRAVESCLATARADIAVQVVVLDSMSDDGSWEELSARFASDPRVILAQNQRGLGPTRSWLDGARLVSGNFVTFLWSDDYVSPQFLDVLFPPLSNGSDLAIGDGAVRDIDDDDPLPTGGATTVGIDGDSLLARHMGLQSGSQLPVSPAVALFTRTLFDRWIDAVEDWCTLPGARHDIMWKRAIGPDLMLFLAGTTSSAQKVTITERIVAQFSSHDGSITISSSSWPLRAGYWLAKWWAVDAAMTHKRPIALPAAARLVAQGLLLQRMGRNERLAAGVDPALVRSFDACVAQARRQLFDTVGAVQGAALIAGSGIRLGWRMASRLLR